MSARRSTRLRRKPTPVYQVEDTRTSADEADGEAEAHEALQDAEDAEDSSSDEGLEGDDEEFNPLKTKPKTPKKARTPSVKPKPEVITRDKKPLESLLVKWRDRFEIDEESATREVLNFVLQACGGTGQCVPEAEPLAQLEMGDLVNHVVEDLEKTNGDYPIASRGKGMKKFHRSFEDFWEVFVKECYESEILFASEIATNFVDWLTTLSSSEVRAIRHTTTIAALALSNALVSTATAISDQLAIATRQLNAETNSPGTKDEQTPPVARKSPNIRKVALLKENKALYESRLQQVLKLVNLVFTGVVVHRYRDVMPEIRVATMQCLGYWITTMPDQFLKDNFLKYHGWLLNDKVAPVRLEVVQILCELYENDAFTERLELFTSRFLPRYLELCNDVDDTVVQECIHLLIAVDKRNLISSDIELQPVEKLVFDADHEDIRKAAAEFVCLQYDAFGVAVSKTKDAKLKKEQLNTQAIALVEFAEEYIQNHAIPESAVEILVDAFWGLDDCRAFFLFGNAPDLSSEQQTILLRLLVASVSKLVGNNAAHPAAKKEAEVLLEEITVAYCKDIPSLFLLYQADSDKLLLLLQLIPMLTLKAEVIGHHSGPIKGLLEKLKHAAEQKENEESNGPEPASSMEELVFEDDSVASYVKEAQRFAFLTFCDARCLFVEKFQDAMPPYNAMEWTLPKVLVLLTQRHFENEMEEADEEEPEFEDDGAEDSLATGEKADAIRAWDEKQQQKAELLVALCRVSLCNPSKKQQAAVVLQHFTSSGKSSVEVVKAFGKRVKTDAPVRYLEIQMTALRQMFNVLLIWKQDLEEATRNENHTAEEVLEQDDLKEKVERCEQEMKELAKRFSQSLGVGKIASSLRLPFLRFLREGVHYSLQQPAQFEFLEAMRGYLSHLDKPSMAQLREYFMECLGALRDIPDDSEGLDPRLSSA
ncbi:hypothetical protein JM18_004037 [Phytophthora kernoviae]|uniref:SCD domain-containing protein n=1 Tax=Phytophthora kernoviae TaxID=325452 RepID=A0A921V7S0_9STRA|nr:hypothetical protein JM18_004037 [Phytophthora kernoviae]